MRILQICNKAPYPANDGSSIAICSLAEGLADSGAELYLLAINTKKHFKPDENVSAAFKNKTHYRSVYQNTDPTAAGALLNLCSSHSYFVSRFYFKAFEAALIDTLQAWDFDIVQVEGVFMATYIPVIRAHSKARIALRTHNVEHQIWERHLPSEKNKLKKHYLQLQNKRLKRFELRAFEQADMIIPITDIDKKNIEALVPGKPVFTCLTGIDLEKYSSSAPTKVPDSVFHFASMDWLPNIEAADWLMNEVWPLVLQKKKDTRLVLAGRDMPERFKRLEGEYVQVIGAVPDSKQFYHDHDVMLVPLWSGSGLRIKLVEGLAYGKAMIATGIGAEGVPYEHGKNIWIADDARQFADAIVSLVTDDAKKQSLSVQARLLAEQHFDYKVLAAGLINFYKTKP